MEAINVSIVLSPGAEADVADAIAWYEASRPRLSWDFRMALDARFDQIARYPDANAKVAPSVRRALLRRFPHAVYYRQQPGIVQIVAILHTHRHPRVWQERDFQSISR